MDIVELAKTFTGGDIVYFFIKAFSLVFSIMYFFYALVMLKQTQVMNKALSTERKNVFSLFSLIQLLLAVFVILLAIFFV